MNWVAYRAEQFLLQLTDETQQLRQEAEMSTAATTGNETVLEEGLSVLRTLQVAAGEIALVAVNQGVDWKVTVEGPGPFQALEFHGPLPKEALDHAESFVRRLLGPVSPE